MDGLSQWKGFLGLRDEAQGIWDWGENDPAYVLQASAGFATRHSQL